MLYPSLALPQYKLGVLDIHILQLLLELLLIGKTNDNAAQKSVGSIYSNQCSKHTTRDRLLPIFP